MRRGLFRRGALIAGLLYACATPYGAPPGAETDGGPSGFLAGDVEVSPQALDFGPVGCGTESSAQVIVLRNLTDAPLSYEARLLDGSALVIKGQASGTIVPRGSVGIPVAAIPKTAGALVGSVLVTAGRSFVEVGARSKGGGAVLELAPTVVDFGEVRKGVRAAPESVKLENTGTEPVTVAAFEGSTPTLGVTVTQPVTIPPGGSASVDAHFNAPKDPGPVEAVLRPVVGGTLCAEPPTMTLRGASVDTTITLSAADFGVQPCDATETVTKNITVSNYSPIDVTVASATLPASSRFRLSSAVPVVVPAATGTTPGTASITIGLAPTSTLGAFEEELSLSIDGVPAPDGGTRKAKLRSDVQGAILSISPSALEFKSNGIYTDYKRFTIENKGNAAISVTYDFQATIGASAWFLERNTETIEPSKTAGIDVGFRPPTTGQHEGRLTPRRVSGAPACTSMPVATVRGRRP